MTGRGKLSTASRGRLFLFGFLIPAPFLSSFRVFRLLIVDMTAALLISDPFCGPRRIFLLLFFYRIVVFAHTCSLALLRAARSRKWIPIRHWANHC